MKIFAYHNGNNGVSQYRIWNPVKYLNRIEGFHVERLPEMTERLSMPLEGSTNIPGIPTHGEAFRDNDLIWDVYRADLENSMRFQALSKLKPHVLDVDDNFLNVDPNNPNAKTWKSKVSTRYEEITLGQYTPEELEDRAKQFNGKICYKDGRVFIVSMGYDPKENALEMVKAASGLTVSTEALKKEFSEYNSNICVAPNSIDFELWNRSEKKDDGIIRLGLFGSNTHYDDWKIIAELLKKILDEFPNVHLCFNSWFSAEFEQGAMFNELQGRKPQFPDYFHNLGLLERSSQVEIYEPCQIQDWPKWMADKGIDIGLAPLEKSRFNNCKSNLRYLEFGALRVPGIYSDVPAFNSDIENGQNGYLAKSQEDWEKRIKALILNAELRRIIGNKAWQDVKNRYDQAVTAKRLAAFFTGIMEGKKNEKIYSDRLIVPA